MRNFLLIVCFAFLQISPPIARPAHGHHSVLLVGNATDHCNLQCGPIQVVHHVQIARTLLLLCTESREPSAECGGHFVAHDVGELRAIVLNGHNGLRSRVAIKYGVSNMRRLVSVCELSV